jgi:hypothetical protein
MLSNLELFVKDFLPGFFPPHFIRSDDPEEPLSLPMNICFFHVSLSMGVKSLSFINTKLLGLQPTILQKRGLKWII